LKSDITGITEIEEGAKVKFKVWEFKKREEPS
jgi:hypothetical protein